MQSDVGGDSRRPTPKFFVPGAKDPEAAWQELRAVSLSKWSHALSDRRVYSFRFSQNVEELTVVVGRSMTARREIRSGRQRGELERQSRSSGGTIIAIFEGNPWVVWQQLGEAREWNNPFIVGLENKPREIVYFEP